MSVVRENFIENQYEWLDAKNKVVVDIGANIGDTAIYFSKIKKARKVIAFEPYPYSYKLAEENIKINKLKNIFAASTRLTPEQEQQEQQKNRQALIPEYLKVLRKMNN